MNELLVAKNTIIRPNPIGTFYQPAGAICNIITKEDIARFWVHFIGYSCHPENRKNFSNFEHTDAVCRQWSDSDYYLNKFVEDNLIDIEDAHDRLKQKYNNIPIDKYIYGPGDLELFNICYYIGEPFELMHNYYNGDRSLLDVVLFRTPPPNTTGPKYKLIDPFPGMVVDTQDLVLIDKYGN